jgi:hypothetical protein
MYRKGSICASYGRKQLPLLRLGRSNAAESTLETQDEKTFDLPDLLPSEDLTYRAGIGPKKIKGSIEED